MLVDFPPLYTQIWNTIYRKPHKCSAHTVHILRCGFNEIFFRSILLPYVACGNSLLGENIHEFVKSTGCTQCEYFTSIFLLHKQNHNGERERIFVHSCIDISAL